MELNEYRPAANSEAWGRLPGEEEDRFIEAEEIIKQPFFFIYGDPRADDMSCFAETEEELIEKMEIFMEGHTVETSGGSKLIIKCDSEIVLRLICSNGIRVKPDVAIKLVPY